MPPMDWQLPATTNDYIVEGLVVDVNEGPPEFILAERRISRVSLRLNPPRM